MTASSGTMPTISAPIGNTPSLAASVLIASKTIDIIKPFEGFKSYNITIYLFTEGKKYKVLTSQITEKSNIIDENVIFNKVELELIKSILKIYKNTFEYLKLVECNYDGI